MGDKKMDNKKTVSVNVFHILKSVMDAKAKKLNDTIREGAAAEHEHELMSKHISHLQQYAGQNSRFDPSEAHDAEELIDTYEYQMKGIGKKIARGKDARKQMEHVTQFDKTYAFACATAQTKRNIMTLNKEREEIEARMDFVSKCIEACEINMMTDAYSDEIATQARDALEYYMAEYDQLAKHLQDVNKSLQEHKTR